MVPASQERTSGIRIRFIEYQSPMVDHIYIVSASRSSKADQRLAPLSNLIHFDQAFRGTLRLTDDFSPHPADTTSLDELVSSQMPITHKERIASFFRNPGRFRGGEWSYPD
jgi:hypothetical protein